MVTKIRAELNILQLFFDEPIDSGVAVNPANYLIYMDAGPSWQPIRAQINENDIIILTFNREWGTGTYQLVCKQLTDKNGNPIHDFSVFFDYGKPQILLPFQLLITEIMADPLPVIGLPAYEYIELFNPTEHTLNLADLQLQFESSSFSMDTSVLLLHPGSYLILCEKNAFERFMPLGRAYGLARWPSIRNTLGTVSLVHNGISIHSVTYDDNWYRNSQKKNGGWSLEMINTANVCDGALNWKASTASTGGSPGGPNSVSDKTFALDWVIDSFSVKDDYTIGFKINKQIDAPDADSFNILPPLGIHSVSAGEKKGTLEIKLASSVQRGLVYQLNFKLKNCIGMWSIPLSTSFIKKEQLEYADLIINEVLFNPLVGGFDYVEVYNRSDKVVSPEGWSLGNENNGQKRRVNSDRWMLPGAYFVFTPEPADVLSHYKKVRPEWLIQQSLPGLPDESGQLTLYSSAGTLIDSISYYEDNHSLFLTSTEGVALERIPPFVPGEPVRWHSASGLEGYGTPTRVNSTNLPTNQAEYFKLKQKVFSPDADGYEDYLQINYSLPARDYLSRIYVYNDQGRLIKKLVDNVVLNHQGNIEWNGTDEKNQLCPTGIYIFNIQALTLEGKSINSRLTTVLALR